MATAWPTDAEVRTDVAYALQLDDVAALATRWQTIAARANLEAQSELTSWLMSLGFVQSEIDTWDAEPKQAAARRLALMLALVKGNPLGSYPDRLLDKLDPRPELKEKGVLIVGGVAVGPTVGASDVGGIAYGTRISRTTLEADYDRRFGRRCL